MISLWLMIGLLLLIAIGFIIYSVPSQKMRIGVGLILIIGSSGLYYHLGNIQGLRNAILLQAFDESPDANLEILPTLILGLNKQLAQHTDDPMTWALLGKIYFTLKDYSNASHSFAKAYTLLPDDPELLVDYATADYLALDGKLNPDLKSLLDKIEKLEPSLDSLSLLANVAYGQGNVTQAIAYWQAMQAQVPKDSSLYQELTLTIEWAQQRLK